MTQRKVTAITPFKIIQGRHIRYQSKSRMRRPVCVNNLHMQSRTVSEISRIIGQISRSIGGASLWRIRSGWTSKFRTAKFDLKKLDTSFYDMMQSVFGYLELFRRD